jgi:hypothetical protein
VLGDVFAGLAGENVVGVAAEEQVAIADLVGEEPVAARDRSREVGVGTAIESTPSPSPSGTAPTKVLCEPPNTTRHSDVAYSPNDVDDQSQGARSARGGAPVTGWGRPGCRKLYAQRRGVVFPCHIGPISAPIIVGVS